MELKPDKHHKVCYSGRHHASNSIHPVDYVPKKIIPKG